MSLAVEHPLVRAACAEACGATDETPRPDSAEELYALKQKVPACIDAIGAKRWRMRVDALSLLHRRPPPHAINRAYAKMSEIMLTSALRCPRSSLHLGEAPGGFVQCIGDAARAGAWNWTAVSLPSGPQFQLEKLPVQCGRVVYADLLDGDAAALADPDARFDLVTADGACEMDHERLEEEHLPLLVAQARIACARCEVGGNVVIKFYEGCHPATLAVLASLTQCFERVAVLKPNSSRPVNSERYVVGRGRLPDQTFQPECKPAAAWVADTNLVVEELLQDQIEALKKIFKSA